MFGLRAGHDAEGGNEFNSQHAVARRHDPDDFGRLALGAPEHGLHLFNRGRHDGQGERPPALLEHLIDVSVGALEFHSLGGIGLSLGVGPGRSWLPFDAGVHNLSENGIDLCGCFFFWDHAERMGNFDEAEIRQALALLCAEREPPKLIGNYGDCRDAGLFKITLVNYQP
uniref:Uncharacterized protein n=1 Tax=Myoviridae sp. ctrnx29 TaxID=2826704 RepID=A0A8S5LXS9_9CAUD|nr:MAG TPA: hypothetical protein [Myoviridae sp. ctrnx29]